MVNPSFSPIGAALRTADRFLVWLGGWIRGILLVGTDYVWFVTTLMRRGPRALRHPHLVLEQMHVIGITSIPLVATTSVFTGAVTAWQAAYLFSDFIPLAYLGIAVGKTVILEMGPVLTALVVAGRTGAGMASELGSMAVTEQLDAMETLGLDKHTFLVAPRVLAGVLMLPVLTVIASSVALGGALAVASLFKDLEPSIFWRGVRQFYEDRDVWVALIKGVVFGWIITTYGCFAGTRARNGAEGVGRAIEKSVQAAAVSILIANFLLGWALLR